MKTEPRNEFQDLMILLGVKSYERRIRYEIRENEMIAYVTLILLFDGHKIEGRGVGSGSMLKRDSINDSVRDGEIQALYNCNKRIAELQGREDNWTIRTEDTESQLNMFYDRYDDDIWTGQQMNIIRYLVNHKVVSRELQDEITHMFDQIMCIKTPSRDYMFDVICSLWFSPDKGVDPESLKPTG